MLLTKSWRAAALLSCEQLLLLAIPCRHVIKICLWDVLEREIER